MLPGRKHLRSADNGLYTTYHGCHRQSVPELFPLLVHKCGISYLHQSVKWTVLRRSSAIQTLVFLWKRTVCFINSLLLVNFFPVIFIVLYFMSFYSVQRRCTLL